MVLMACRQYALALLFVYLSQGFMNQIHPLPVRSSHGCQCTCNCKCPGCSRECLCKCPPGCVQCAQQSTCNCKSEPVIAALTGQGKGEDDFLVLQWCDKPAEELDERDLSGPALKARVKALLRAHRGGPSQPTANTDGKLVPLLPYCEV
jgi:hypothetical protein